MLFLGPLLPRSPRRPPLGVPHCVNSQVKSRAMVPAGHMSPFIFPFSCPPVSNQVCTGS